MHVSQNRLFETTPVEARMSAIAARRAHSDRVEVGERRSSTKGDQNGEEESESEAPRRRVTWGRADSEQISKVLGRRGSRERRGSALALPEESIDSKFARKQSIQLKPGEVVILDDGGPQGGTPESSWYGGNELVEARPKV